MLIIVTALSRAASGSSPTRQSRAGRALRRRTTRTDAARQLARQRRQHARQFHYRGRARRIVVGAREELTDLGRRERAVVAATEVVVVRAEDDVFVGLAGQVREHVGDRRMELRARHVASEAWSLPGTQTMLGVAGGVDLVGRCRAGFDRPSGTTGRPRRCWTCTTGMPCLPAPPSPPNVVNRSGWPRTCLLAVDDDDRRRAELARRRMALAITLSSSVEPSFGARARSEGRASLAQHDNDLALDVEPGVVVVLPVRRR